MTKKQLLESEVFAAMPDDTQLVFRTSSNIHGCVPLMFEHIWYEKRCINLDAIKDAPINVREHVKPKYRNFIMINAMPFDLMEKRYNMTFDV